MSLPKSSYICNIIKWVTYLKRRQIEGGISLILTLAIYCPGFHLVDLPYYFLHLGDKFGIVKIFDTFLKIFHDYI